MIKARNLQVLDGARFAATAAGIGDAGEVNLNIEETAYFEGNNPGDLIPSGVFSGLTSGGKGDGGAVRISATNLSVLNGARISTSTLGGGEAGDVNLVIKEAVRLAGRTDADLAEIIDGDDGNNSGIFSRALSFGQGQGGGDIQISAANLLILDEAEISAGVGINEDIATVNRDAGNITLTITDLLLLQNGKIITDAIRTDDAPSPDNSLPQVETGTGNITIAASITTEDDGDISVKENTGVLILRDNSLLTAEASTDSDGGNITINADFVVAAPNENSDIIANAVSGDGGQINITATRIYGLVEQRGFTTDELRSNDSNDISASSQSGDSGSINLTNLGLDPTREAPSLPSIPGADDIAQGCKRVPLKQPSLLVLDEVAFLPIRANHSKMTIHRSADSLVSWLMGPLRRMDRLAA